MSRSSYSHTTGEPLKGDDRRGKSVAPGKDLFDALFSDEYEPSDNAPNLESELSKGEELALSDEHVANTQKTAGETEEQKSDRASRFFTDEQIRKKKTSALAKSFTDKFIDTSVGGPETDEELFFRYQKGDEKAFYVLYERYKSSVYAYCSKVLLSAGLSSETVQDTYQEVFLRVSQYRNTFTTGEFRAWIFTITRNTCLSWKKRGLRASVNNVGGIDPDHLSEDQALASRSGIQRSDDPLEILSVKEQTDLLLKAISELPDTYREALMLCEYEGLTYEEIGKITGTSLSTIRIRVFRAKKRLRKVLLPVLGIESEGNLKKNTSVSRHEADEEDHDDE